MKIIILAVCLLLASVLTVYPASRQEDDHRGKDGKFHDPDSGEVQPEMCDNGFKNEHKCECYKTTTQCEGTEPGPAKRCQTFCRLKACSCVSTCGS
jgi:hypothetical protein